MPSAPEHLSRYRRATACSSWRRVSSAARSARSNSPAPTGRPAPTAPTTVSSLVAELLAEGVLTEPAGGAARAASPGGGRPATPLSLNPDVGGVLGVHLGHDGIRVLFTNLSGGVLAEHHRELDVDHRPD